MARRRPDVCYYKQIYDTNEGPFDCDPAFFTHKILCEGDSWFTIGGTNLKNPWFSNLLFTLRFPTDTLILNLAHPGDTIRNISDMLNNISFRYALESEKNKPWNAIVLSAGGNDLIDEAQNLILEKSKWPRPVINNVADYCDSILVTNFFNNIEKNYRSLAKVRVDQSIPIVIHTYDYPTPRNSAARFFKIKLSGPWLYTAMENAEIPKGDWIALSDYLFNLLADRLLSLSKGTNRIPNFHAIDTRNTLTRAQFGAKGESGDWLNEIHPNKNGYLKIAHLIEKKLSEVTGIRY